MRVQLVDSKQKFLYTNPDGMYCLHVNLSRFTAAVTTGAVFAMRNTLTNNNKVLALKKFILHSAFSGTTAASVQLFQIQRFDSATHSGGTSILATMGKCDTMAPASAVLDARIADITNTSPLTATNVVYRGYCFGFILPRNPGGANIHIHENLENRQCFLRPGEGFALTILNTAVVGDGAVLDLQWDEYDANLVGNQLM